MNTFFTDKKPIKVVGKNHEDWLQLRKGIGSSDVPTILGINKWCTPYQLWLEKTGRMPPKEETLLMNLGHKLEPVIAELWSESTGIAITEGSEEEYVYVHPEYDFIRASPDREFLKNGLKGILECKSTQIKIEELPPYWFAQVQYQMGISQIEYNNIAWLIQGREFDFAEVLYNRDFFEYEVEEVKRFWYEHVLADVPPECSNATDIILRYENTFPQNIEATQSIIEIFSLLKEARVEKQRLEEKENIYKEQLQLFMQANEQLTYEGETLCTWRTGKSKQKFDEKKFKEENPELYAKYLVSKHGNRTFLIK